MSCLICQCKFDEIWLLLVNKVNVIFLRGEPGVAYTAGTRGTDERVKLPPADA